MNKVQQFWQKIVNSPDLRKKALFTLLIFTIARFLAEVPLPEIDTARLQMIFANSEFLSFLNIIAGGTLSSFSIVAVGISPYITASIVIQLLTMIWPKLKEMQKDGEKGRAQLNQYTRLLSLPVAILQSFSIIAILRSQDLLLNNSAGAIMTIIFFLTVGSFIMLWLGELITAKGLGNGISMIMILGILSQLPTTFAQSAQLAQTGEWFLLLAIVAGIVATVAVVVYINQATRKIPIQYATRMQGNRKVGGQTTFFPLKLNSVGVMPIIFAVTLMTIPSFLGQILANVSNDWWRSFGENLQVIFSQTNPIYIVLYFLIVFGLSYFSALLFFNARDVSEELKKSGAFVPGVRPGQQTQAFLEKVIKRLTFVDGLFLGVIAILPFILQIITGMSSLAIGGTSLLILVSVILEVNKIVEGSATSQDYDQYL
ncbi:MAG: preprotein translocase subunit SecY [bacterium]|nr:preprotein translocase subunit SecY [bacterium]